ncbi:ImmA/IrrE family metallo-endopeptidase [Sphingobacterium sp.]|uniref:ImmA/IrrE family metallo-endopeptidase n=1 Tax=Sphingobacterium sp. TaxID=341027 RepID=UPI0028965627|nr:ImmA/IrrE family metallo-endopeptidase [Sphingobacterium sp.]
MSEKYFNVDELLSSLFPDESLFTLFENRIQELGIAPTNALEIMEIEFRALQNILHGTSPRVDTRNLMKLSNFLNLPLERVVKLFYRALESNFPELQEFPQEKIEFINKNFDLAMLKRMGFIKDLANYRHIEDCILRYFGYKSIFEFKLPDQDVAFSAGIRPPKSKLTKGFWIKSAIDTFAILSNPYDYDRKNLMAYIPEIRWQSINVENGLKNVVNDLFRLGVTVLYQTSVPSLHLKGATIIVDDKPCIVLTDYMGFYTTLWHTLCHELSHVLFDFEEIKKNKYHISEEQNSELPIQEKEKEADNFAREFLFSKEKLDLVKPHINNKKFVEEYALRNQIHESFIYTYYAREFGKDDPKAWARVKAKDPSFKSIMEYIENPWDKFSPIEDHIEKLKNNGIYS